MELKHYFRILAKRWWIVLAAFILTLIPTIIFSNSQPWIYETRATFVIRPRPSFAVNDEEIVKALDIVSRRVEINTTFAEVSSSSLVKQKAIESLGLTGTERQGLKVSGRVVAGTNLLEITVQGQDPKIVRDFANAVSKETLAYVSSLYDVFELEPLDEADLPKRPSSPNRLLNIALGGILGIFLGIGLVFLAEYLAEPIRIDSQVSIIDLETGAYNRPYLMLRLRQEMSRARHNDYSFSLALIKVYSRGLVKSVAQSLPPADALRLIVTNLGPNLREEDIVAHIGDGTFALLLPDMPGEAAQDIFNFLRAQIGQVPPGQIDIDRGSAIYCSIGIVVFHHSDAIANENELLAQANQALQEANTAVYGKVHLATVAPSAQAETSSLAQFFQKQTGKTGD